MRRVLVGQSPARAACTLLLAVLLLVGGGGEVRADGPAAPAGWPLTSPAPVLRPFDPPAERWGRGHRGVDLAASVGDRVLATGAGRVSFAGTVAGRGVVVVDHGRLRTTYQPVTASVPVGTRVRLGDPVGRLAGGGHCPARACLHWGLRQGRDYLNPLGPRADQGPAARTPIRLLPASARALAQRRAAARAAAALAAEAAARLAGVPPVAAAAAYGGRHGFLRPVPGAITSKFGRRFHPVLRVWKLHDGTDFGASCGTPIRAPYAGVVTRASRSPAYGHRLFLDHGTVAGRRVRTSYNHASRYVVRPGSRVASGQLLGYVGNTGYSTGCHLHLMAWLNGRLTNPMSVL